MNVMKELDWNLNQELIVDDNLFVFLLVEIIG